MSNVSKEILVLIKEVIDIEGGFSDHPLDKGGKTNYGVTEKLARKHGYDGDMNDLPFEVAVEIIVKEFVIPLNLQKIYKLSAKVAREVLDTAVNTGANRAGVFLQQGLNLFNNRGELFKDLKTDGVIGNMTLDALRGFLKFRKDDTVLVFELNIAQYNFYKNIATQHKDDKDEAFIYGWVDKRVLPIFKEQSKIVIVENENEGDSQNGSQEPAGTTGATA